MASSSVVKWMAAGAVLVGLGSVAAMAGPADDAILARQGCMKAHGASMKVMVPMFKGEAAFDAAAIQATFAKEEAACADWSKWWGPETQKGETVKTEAKAEIWSDPAGFEEAGKVWYAAYTAVKGAGDDAAFKAAFPALGASCKGCHEKFRAAE